MSGPIDQELLRREILAAVEPGEGVRARDVFYRIERRLPGVTLAWIELELLQLWIAGDWRRRDRASELGPVYTKIS